MREGWELSGVSHSFIRNIEEYNSPLQIKTLSEHTSAHLSSQPWGDGCRRIQSSKQAWARKLRHCVKEKNHLLGKLKRRVMYVGRGKWAGCQTPGSWQTWALREDVLSVEALAVSSTASLTEAMFSLLSKWRNQMWCLCLPSQHLGG